MAEGADTWSALGLSRSGLSRYLRVAQTMVGLRGEVDVMLADDRTLRRLNREWRGKDKATDVLSFPAAAEMAGIHAGDLAISFDTAAKQAKEHGHTLRDEVRILMLHGLLHLAGMDHEVDRGEMAEREAELRGKLRLQRGLIARVGEKQIPSGNDRKKSKGNNKSRSFTPFRMTNHKSQDLEAATPKGKSKGVAMRRKVAA
jgi:probable rRNA maturation factor